LDFAVTMGLSASVGEHGLPPLLVKAGEGGEWIVGEGEPAARLEGAPFDLFRALTGRRSAAQIRALRWTGDPDTYLPAFTFGPFTVPPVDVVD
jgi:hypothetical protein